VIHDVGLIAFPWYPSLETGRGHDTYAYHLLNNLSKQNLDVKNFPVLSLNQLQQGVNKFDYMTKEVLFFTKVFSPRARVYHGISPIGAKTAILANKRPLITTIHDAIPFVHQRDIRQAYERLCIKLCCEKSNILIFTSEFTKNFLRDKIRFDSSKAKVIKCGVDHNAFFHRKKRKKKGKVVFSILRWGDIDQFLNAFKTVTKEVENVTLVLGIKNSFESDYNAKIPYLLEKKGLEKSVKIIKDVPASCLPVYYNNADVYVSPSVGGFSLTLLESMACGTPVIAFGALDAPEYVGKEGVLVKPNDFHSLADETIRLLLDQKAKNELRKRSIEKSRNFSWEKMTSEIVEVYKELMISKLNR
jgi:glycosyltransferase involved in cell wall biosynthesis